MVNFAVMNSEIQLHIRKKQCVIATLCNCKFSSTKCLSM
uniref:Uncharacterized protein n=1 Tax=Arundo donax TaxID=35708 RepID=A0A0A9GB94_ARUDO